MDIHPPIPPASRANWPKRIAGLMVVATLITAVCLWLGTDTGHQIRNDPRQVYRDFQPFLDRHLLLAPLAYIGIYVGLAVMALPVWWLQILAGIGFGLYEGTFVSLISATIGSVITVALSRWLAADWFHDRIEKQMQQLARLDDLMGHNGLLVVMTVRLVHVLPFGAINYALGVTRVSYIDVMIGSFLGGVPAVAMYVGIGAGYHPLTNWRFDTILGAINLVLLLPLILRYARPHWFKKFGVE